MVFSNEYFCNKLHDKVLAGSHDLPCCVTVAAPTRGCVVAEVVAVCAAPCIRFGQFNAFLMVFQIEESEGTSVWPL